MESSQLIEFITNHPMLVLALVAILVLLIGGELRQRLSGVSEVGPVEATRMLNHDNAVMIDMREDKDYREGHIINAIHIPLSDFGRRSAELDRYKDRPVIAYCRSGGRSVRLGRRHLQVHGKNCWQLRIGV